jgi:hypothetical protein
VRFSTQKQSPVKKFQDETLLVCHRRYRKIIQRLGVFGDNYLTVDGVE